MSNENSIGPRGPEMDVEAKRSEGPAKGLQALQKLKEKLSTMPMAEFECALIKFHNDFTLQGESMKTYTSGTPTKLSEAIQGGIDDFENDTSADSVKTLVEYIRASVEEFTRNKLNTLALAQDEQELTNYINSFVKSLA